MMTEKVNRDFNQLKQFVEGTITELTNQRMEI